MGMNLILDLLLEFNGQNKTKTLQPQTPVCFFLSLYALTWMHLYILCIDEWMNKLGKYTVCFSVAHIYCNDLSDLHKVLLTAAENINSSQNEAFSCYHSSGHFFPHPNARKMHMIYLLCGNTYWSLVLRMLFTPCYFSIHYMSHFLLQFWLLHQSSLSVICYLSNTLLINSWFFYSHYRF